jgi:hypothetical protein
MEHVIWHGVIIKTIAWSPMKFEQVTAKKNSSRVPNLKKLESIVFKHPVALIYYLFHIYFLLQCNLLSSHSSSSLHVLCLAIFVATLRVDHTFNTFPYIFVYRFVPEPAGHNTERRREAALNNSSNRVVTRVTVRRPRERRSRWKTRR